MRAPVNFASSATFPPFAFAIALTVTAIDSFFLSIFSLSLSG
jgi:hypothetical protein